MGVVLGRVVAVGWSLSEAAVLREEVEVLEQVEELQEAVVLEKVRELRMDVVLEEVVVELRLAVVLEEVERVKEAGQHHDDAAA